MRGLRQHKIMDFTRAVSFLLNSIPSVVTGKWQAMIRQLINHKVTNIMSEKNLRVVYVTLIWTPS